MTCCPRHDAGYPCPHTPSSERDDLVRTLAAERTGRRSRHARLLRRRRNARRAQELRAALLPASCAYCGGVATEVDHVTPLARGGTDDLANVVPCCRRCNAEKSDMTPDEWRSWRIEEGRPWPPTRRLTLEVPA